MNSRRWLYTLVLVAGLLSAVAVLAVGALVALRLSQLAKPQHQRHGNQTAGTPKSAATVTSSSDSAADPRAQFAPEPLDKDPAAKSNPELSPPDANASDTTHPDATKSAPPSSAPSDQKPPDDQRTADARLPAGPQPSPGEQPPRALTEIERRTGSYFEPTREDRTGRPEVVEIAVPNTYGSNAIWGATGRDALGRVWYGVTESWGEFPSAHLFQLDPATLQSADMGDVVSQLQRAGIARQGERQQKIHSRIVQADDGFLYFASMDEAGEKEDGSQLPTWGGHLWRLRLSDYHWEHLAATPEALLAVGTSGKLVYALGYFDHVLYQFDTRTSKLRSVRVGAVEGHTTRNFLVDGRGHAFVPRLSAAPPGSSALAIDSAAAGAKPPPPVASLVEYDADLQEIGRTPLQYYANPAESPAMCHGIVGLCDLADGSLVMVTHVGYLYRVTPSASGPAQVTPLGWFHPQGTSYTPSLFTPDGSRYLLGLGQRGKGPFQWLSFDLTTGRSQAANVVIADLFTPPRQDMIVYGSMTTDFQGRFYMAGRYVTSTGSSPLLVRVQPAK
ncbi:MAG: hypothetical protein K8T25_03895 [Planctomycetia bacterium]|nr:hypothetical protein [Planctomycetia bacterium]